MAIPVGTVGPDHPWWGNPSFEIKYDPDAARALMEESGFSADNPVKVKVQTSASGSGQMQPIPMNEYVQQSLRDCYFDVELDVLEWNTLFTNWRRGADDETANGAHAINVSFAAMDPFFAMVRFTSTGTFPPVSNNWGYFGNDEFDALIADARTSFDDAERDAALARCTSGSSRKRPSSGSPTMSARGRCRPGSRTWSSRGPGSSTSRR
jgi:peptide/nickel transport system substrate-binding protein